MTIEALIVTLYLRHTGWMNTQLPSSEGNQEIDLSLLLLLSCWGTQNKQQMFWHREQPNETGPHLQFSCLSFKLKYGTKLLTLIVVPLGSGKIWKFVKSRMRWVRSPRPGQGLLSPMCRPRNSRDSSALHHATLQFVIHVTICNVCTREQFSRLLRGPPAPVTVIAEITPHWFSSVFTAL